MVEVTGCSVLFSLKPIMLELQGGRYNGPILPISQTNLVRGRRSEGSGAPRSGDSNSGSGGNRKTTTKVGAMGGPARVWVRYEAHLPSRGQFWWGRYSPPCTVTFFLRADICAGCDGRTVSVKTPRSPSLQRCQPKSPGYLKCIRGDYRFACSLAAEGCLPPQIPGLSRLDLQR